MDSHWCPSFWLVSMGGYYLISYHSACFLLLLAVQGWGRVEVLWHFSWPLANLNLPAWFPFSVLPHHWGGAGEGAKENMSLPTNPRPILSYPALELKVIQEHVIPTKEALQHRRPWPLLNRPRHPENSGAESQQPLLPPVGVMLYAALSPVHTEKHVRAPSLPPSLPHVPAETGSAAAMDEPPLLRRSEEWPGRFASIPVQKAGEFGSET